MQTHQNLFGTHNLTDFINKKFGKCHNLWKIDPTLTKKLIDSWRIDNLIYKAGGMWGDVRIAKYSKSSKLEEAMIEKITPTPANIDALQKRGYTFVANNIQQHSALIFEICQHLEHEFLAKTNCNVYVTPANGQALQKHYDDHDVFIVQLKGCKSWKVTTPKENHEPRPEVPYFEDINSQTELTSPYLLNPGHVLYIPAGSPHQAYAGRHGSTHLSFSVQPPCMKDLIDSILADLFLDRYTGTVLRQRIPSLDIHNCTASAELLEAIDETIKNIARWTSMPGRHNHYASQLGQLVNNINDARNLPILNTDFETITENTMLIKNPNTPVTGPSQNNQLFFKHGNLAITPESEKLAVKIKAGLPITVSELPGVAEEKAQIANHMISSGLMVIHYALLD
jgi:ribosomal protein L16 Arg81 hydroxylase